ncbi:YlbD family protein [Bacillus piscicola]|uniref:YlbD family protein n=1 Tax=Bacillus piscicola TaxID=1632684 RepID=UPI001F09B76B|nr:YlbD family protein [Bacillus piscicola]
MSKETLPPSVQEFRTFIQSHPGLIKEVREGRRTWNELYQDWVILGEDHEDWTAYQSTTKSMNDEQGETVPALMKMLSQINIQELQQQMSQFSGVIGNVQRVLSQFQKPSNPKRPPQDPFSFRGF